MQQIRDLVNERRRRELQRTERRIGAAGGFGIEVVDVRIKRADLPPANSEGIYKRMQTERKREANQYRAQGAEDAQKIRSQADKERTILLAEARKQAEITARRRRRRSHAIFADPSARTRISSSFTAPCRPTARR